jgi:DNA-binding HxlR family transcriptional regulator
MSERVRLRDSWEGALLVEILPWAQGAIIDALKAAEHPLSEADLLTALEKEGPVGSRIKHHLSRLKNLNAIEVEVDETGSERVKYRLTERPGHGDRCVT